MTAFLEEIFLPQIEFEGPESLEKFVNLFSDLYRIELFKDGLDLILTEIQKKHLKFEVRIIKGWDTNVGCFLTEQKSFYDQTLGKFLRKSEQKIILRKLSHNVLAHEMAHALELKSEVNLGEDFRRAIGLDMKNREPQIITLKAEIKRLMVEALKSYPPQQFLSELFARYFELLSVSRDVHSLGDFSTNEVMDFFANTTRFLKEIFNPLIKAKIDPKIAKTTQEIARKIKLAQPKQKFQEKVQSLGKSWVKNVKSNASWQAGWQEYQQLQTDKKKN
jgi:hypothetical protein